MTTFLSSCVLFRTIPEGDSCQGLKNLASRLAMMTQKLMELAVKMTRNLMLVNLVFPRNQQSHWVVPSESLEVSPS